MAEPLVNLDLDTEAWEAALAKYASVTKKEMEYVMFRQTKNLLFHLAEQMPNSKVANRQQKRPLWQIIGCGDDPRAICSLIASILRNKVQYASLGEGKMKRVRRKGVKRGQFTIVSKSGRVTLKGWATRSSKYYTRDIARRYTRKMENARNARFGFSRLIPYEGVKAVVETAAAAGLKITKTMPTGTRKKSRGGTAPDSYIQITNRGNKNTVDLRMSVVYRFRNPTTLAGKPVIDTAMFYQYALTWGLRSAYRATIEDINSYLARRMGKQSTDKSAVTIGGKTNSAEALIADGKKDLGIQ